RTPHLVPAIFSGFRGAVIRPCGPFELPPEVCCFVFLLAGILYLLCFRCECRNHSTRVDQTGRESISRCDYACGPAYKVKVVSEISPAVIACQVKSGAVASLCASPFPAHLTNAGG